MSNIVAGLIDPSFFADSTEIVAKKIIGKILRRQIADAEFACRIVEAEAYLPVNDDACHASKKKTRKNEVMFEEAGSIYVYAIHAKHCLNFVTDAPGVGCAVLIRAAEPLIGIESMKQNRNRFSELELLNGPGKLCQALEIDKSLNGKKLSKTCGLWIEDDGTSVPDSAIRSTERIGVTSAEDLPLRFVLKSSRFASGPKRLR